MSQILKTILLLNTKTIMQRSACYQAWRENKKIYPNLTYYNLAEAVSKIWIIKGKKTGTLMYGINLGLEIWSSHEFLGSSSILLYVLVTQSCLTLWDPRDCSPPGSSVHGISQARMLEWVAISCFSEVYKMWIKSQRCYKTRQLLGGAGGDEEWLLKGRLLCP